MKRFLLLICTSVLLLSACSTAMMERRLAEERRIDVETYAYNDERFIYNAQLVQELANRFRLKELTPQNVQSIMRDEIRAGNFNEVIIYIRHLQANHEEQAALYTERFYEAINAHVQRLRQPSAMLVAEAIRNAKQQYEQDPEDQRNIVQYAMLLVESNVERAKGLELMYELQERLEQSEEDMQRATMQALASAFYIDEKYQESKEMYLRLITLDPEDATLYYSLSLVLNALGEKDSAEEYLMRAYEPTMRFLATYGTNAYGIHKSFFLNGQ